MITLTEINQTLLDQNKNLENIAEETKGTSKGLNSLVSKISAQMEKAELSNLKEKNKPRAATGTLGQSIKAKITSPAENAPSGLLDGLLKGLGFGGAAGLTAKVAGVLTGLLGAGLGMIGKAGGRLLRTGLLLGAVNAWGDDLVDWVSNNLLSEQLSEADKKAAFSALQVSAVTAGLGLGIVKSLLAGALTYMFPTQTEAAGGWLTDGMVSLLDTLGFKTEWWTNLDEGTKGQVNTAIGGLMGAIVLQMALALTGKKILIPLAGIIAAKAWDSIKSLPDLLKGADDVVPTSSPKTRGGKRGPKIPDTPSPGPGRANPARVTRKAATQAAKTAAYAANLAQYGKAKDLAKYGFARNATGALIEAGGSKKFKSAEDLAEAILTQKAAKAAKYARFLKVIGPLGALVDLYDPLWAIYTDQPENVVKKELAGTLGSVSGAYLGAIGGAAATTLIPVVGQSGIGNIIGGLLGAVAGSFAGEYTAESLADFLLGGTKPKPVSLEEGYSRSDVNYDFTGAASVSGTTPGPNDLSSYAQYMSPPTRPAPAGAPNRASVLQNRSLSAVTAGVMQMDYNRGDNSAAMQEIAGYLASIAANSGGGGSVAAPVTNNSFLLPQGSTSDILDGGFAARMGPR